MKTIVSFMLVCLFIFFGVSGSAYATEQGLHSHSITSFYGVYEESQSSETSHSNENGGGANENISGLTTHNYSTSGHEIIPETGEQDFIIIQSSGYVLLFSAITLLWGQKRKGENF